MKNYFSSSMVQILENAMNEVICEEKSKILKSNLSKENCSSELTIDEIFDLFKSLGRFESFYGKKGALGIITKIGQSSHRYFFRFKGIDYNLNHLDYRLMNPKKRYQFGLEQIAKFVSENSLWNAQIMNTSETWIWHMVEKSEKPILNELWGAFFNGFISEYLLWTSGGRFFILTSELLDGENKITYQLHITKKPLGN